MKKLFLVFTIASLTFVACNNKTSDSGESTTETTTETAPAETPESNVATVELNAGDDMKYDLSEIVVEAGQTVKLTLHHTGQSPATTMGHNFVLLKAGVDFDKFVLATATATEATDHIPADHAADVIAHTKTIGGGESTEIEFPAPPAGTYDFLCSFPGHAALMKGKFIVE